MSDGRKCDWCLGEIGSARNDGTLPPSMQPVSMHHTETIELHFCSFACRSEYLRVHRERRNNGLSLEDYQAWPERLSAVAKTCDKRRKKQKDEEPFDRFKEIRRGSIDS